MNNPKRTGSISIALCITFAAIARLQAGPPVITVQPEGATIQALTDYTLSVSASGTSPLLYQWRFNNLPIVGAMANQLVLKSVTPSQSGAYSVIVANLFGTAVSANAVLDVQPLQITTQPQSWNLVGGANVTLNVGASGPGLILYQWLFNGLPILGANSSQLALQNVAAAQSGVYSVLVSNSLGSLLSDNAVLTVFDFVQQPLSQLVALGSTVVLSVGAQGPNLHYHWALNGDYIPGATNSTLVLNNVGPADGGRFSATVYNDWAALNSAGANVVVDTLALPFADNFAYRGVISTMTGSGRGDNDKAARESGEPLHDGRQGNRSIWLAWVAPANGVATFSTDGTCFDSVLAVYTGKAVNALTPVAGDDDAGGYHTSRVMFNASAGMEYEIAVDSFSWDTGPVVLNWNLFPTQFPMPSITQAPQNTTVKWGANATLSVNYQSAVPVDLQWYRLGQPLPGAKNAILSLNNVTDLVLGQYSVVLNNGEVSVSTEPVELQINTEGISHALAQNKPADAAQSGIKVTLQSAPPLRRGWRAALPRGVIKLATIAPVSGYSGSQIFNNAPGKDPGEPNHCNTVGGSSYWFSYQAPAAGILSADTVGSSFNTILAVYIDDGRSLGYGSLVPLACNVNGTSSAVKLDATAGQIYYIVVDGVNGATGTAFLNYNLNGYPTVSSIANQIINENKSTTALSLTVGDRETAADSFVLGGSSSDPNLVPASGITFGGSGSSRTVTVKPAAYHYGTATITIKVTDGGGASTATSFGLTVNYVNSNPVSRPDSGYREPNKSCWLAISSLLSNDSDPDGDPITLAAVASSSYYKGTVQLSGSYVIYYPPANFNSTDWFAYKISDGEGGTAVGTVTIYVTNASY